MTWVKKVTAPCECPRRPVLSEGNIPYLKEAGCWPGSQWQCDELDCSKVWEITPADVTTWCWTLVHPIGGSE